MGDGFLEPAIVITPDAIQGSAIAAIAVDENGYIWMLLTSKSNTELRKVSVRGELIGSWQLPSKYRWVSGLCALGLGDELLFASSGVRNEVPLPELWHVKIGTGRGVTN